MRYLTLEAGIRQFLDIGPGLPSAGAAHEVAQAIAPDARVAYVDNDPMVITHARALLGHGHGGICLEGDLAEPERILAEVGAPGGLDLSQPIGLLLIAVLHFLLASADPPGVVRTLMDTLAPGSYAVISHLTRDHDPVRVTAAMKVGDEVGLPSRAVTLEEFRGYFAGLELIEPGIVVISDWRRDIPGPRPLPSQVNFYAGVGVKPAP